MYPVHCDWLTCRPGCLQCLLYMLHVCRVLCFSDILCTCTCYFKYCQCLHMCICRDQPHLVPVNYGRPAAVHHRQADNSLGRLKVTVAQVYTWTGHTCTCILCMCIWAPVAQRGHNHNPGVSRCKDFAILSLSVGATMFMYM